MKKIIKKNSLSISCPLYATSLAKWYERKMISDVGRPCPQGALNLMKNKMIKKKIIEGIQ